MNNEKFTQGDWSIFYHPNSSSIISVAIGENETNYSSASVTLYNQEHNANANLIAAAPKMYRMLDYLAKGEGLQPGDTIERLLAEARGEKTELKDPTEVLSTINTEVNE